VNPSVNPLLLSTVFDGSQSLTDSSPPFWVNYGHGMWMRGTTVA